MITLGLDRHIVATHGTLGGKPRIAGRHIDRAIEEGDAVVKALRAVTPSKLAQRMAERGRQ